MISQVTFNSMVLKLGWNSTVIALGVSRIKNRITGCSKNNGDCHLSIASSLLGPGLISRSSIYYLTLFSQDPVGRILVPIPKKPMGA